LTLTADDVDTLAGVALVNNSDSVECTEVCQMQTKNLEVRHWRGLCWICSGLLGKHLSDLRIDLVGRQVLPTTKLPISREADGSTKVTLKVMSVCLW
jgi:hypothetical protein